MSDTQKDFYKKLLGRVGENQACKFLKKKKYKILEKNFACTFGEVDIIAQDKETIVFVEVKTRSDERFGEPMEAVNDTKQRRIILSAKYYLQKCGINENDISVRFDVIEIKNDNGNLTINHIENAFITGTQVRVFKNGF